MIEFPYSIYGIRAKEYDLIYIPLLKNAHTWGEKFFSHNFGCTETVFITKNNTELYKDSKIIVIIRDPVDRWISALAQYLSEFDNADSMLDNLLIKKLITDGVIFDNHARPQLYNLIGLPKKQTVFFWCDDHLEKHINLYSLKVFNKPAESVGEHNRNSQNPAKVILYSKIKDMVNTDQELYNKLKSYYSMDYNLIKQINHRTFYNLYAGDKL